VPMLPCKPNSRCDLRETKLAPDTRWGSRIRDPIGYIGMANLFCYSKNMPTRAVDPSGPIELIFIPEKVDGMPWHDGSPPHLPEIHHEAAGLAETDTEIACDCIQKNCGSDFTLKCKIVTKSEIWLWPAIEDDLPGVYGHEQRHVLCARNFIRGTVAPFVSAKEKASLGKSQCLAEAANLMDTVEGMISDFNRNVNARHRPPCPESRKHYPPIGTMPEGIPVPIPGDPSAPPSSLPSH